MVYAKKYYLYSVSNFAVWNIDESVHWYWYWFFQSTDHFWYWCTGTDTGTGPVFKYWLCTGTDRASTESISTSTKTKKKAKNQAKNWRQRSLPKHVIFFFSNWNFKLKKFKIALQNLNFPHENWFFSRKIEISRRFCSIFVVLVLVLVLNSIIFWYWYWYWTQ